MILKHYIGKEIDWSIERFLLNCSANVLYWIALCVSVLWKCHRVLETWEDGGWYWPHQAQRVQRDHSGPLRLQSVWHLVHALLNGLLAEGAYKIHQKWPLVHLKSLPHPLSHCLLCRLTVYKSYTGQEEQRRQTEFRRLWGKNIVSTRCYVHVNVYKLPRNFWPHNRKVQ